MGWENLRVHAWTLGMLLVTRGGKPTPISIGGLLWILHERVFCSTMWMGVE